MRYLALMSVLLSFSSLCMAYEVGEVDTSFKILGPNHKIVIEGFQDPRISGVTCHISRAKRGGITGGIGIATDTSDASIACRQTGPINEDKVARLEDGEEVFKKSTSILFKTMQVVRFYDEEANTIVYLVYSDKLIDGSPKNSISTVPIMNWD